ncbi:hypothetical protein ACNKHO_10255 [Shigella flexneri]
MQGDEKAHALRVLRAALENANRTWPWDGIRLIARVLSRPQRPALPAAAQRGGANPGDAMFLFAQR